MTSVVQNQFGVMVGLKGTEMISTSIPEVANKQRLVPLDSPLIATARSVGMSFGDQ